MMPAGTPEVVVGTVEENYVDSRDITVANQLTFPSP